MNRLTTIATVSALVIATDIAIAPGSAQAQASGVTCGATVTTDTTLTIDLLDCPNNGLVIGADDITLDLNGHVIRGNGTPVASCPEGAICDVGIVNSSGHTGVTIKGGGVEAFNVAVLVIGASENRVERIRSANNARFGLMVSGSNRSRVDHDSSVSDGISGIILIDSSQVRADHNSITGTTGYAVPVFGSSHNSLDHNLLWNDQHGFLLEGSEQHSGSDDNDIRSNRLADGPSIEIAHSSGNQVRDNALSDPGDGILLIESRRTDVSANSITRAGVGFDETGGFGILLDGADENVLQGNHLTGGKGPAVFVTSLESPESADRNVLTGNVVDGTLVMGILVTGNATGNLLEANTANGNGDDGIHVDAPGTTITGNTADDNLDLGIEAVPGVIDGGGNTASGNGNAAQCLNVVCR